MLIAGGGKLPAQLPGTLARLEERGIGRAAFFFLQMTVSNIFPIHLPATWAMVLLTFSSAFCTLVGCYDNCHGADAMFIKLPVANPDW